MYKHRHVFVNVYRKKLHLIDLNVQFCIWDKYVQKLDETKTKREAPAPF